MENRHTYYPVCGENQDDVIGILDTRDYFRTAEKAKEKVVEQAVQEVFFVPESMKANILLRKMKQERRYFAVIIDEYGGMTGIVTLHDLLETLVGEMEEKEEAEKPEDIEELPDGGWKIRGYADLEEVAQVWNRTLPTDVYETFSGFVCGLIGRVPADGEKFVWEENGMKIDVKKVEGHMIQEADVYIH